jgi:hypothetical protein
MKKLIYTTILGMSMLTACGPSAEEKAAKEKALADSLAAVATAQVTADSLKAVATADSLKKADEESRLKAYNDSVAAASTAAEANKGKKK